MSILFIGGGNMASALVGGLLQKGTPAAQMRVVDVTAEARERVVAAFGVAVRPEAAAADVSAAQAVLLAVKPQHMRAVAVGLGPMLSGQLVITIAAGIRTADLSRWLGGHRRIVRVMPNTPALIGKGMSALWAPPEVDAPGREQAQRILAAVGDTVWCEREEQLDAATAVSGSGPAYVFYFLEALEQSARDLGFDADAARLLAYRTFAGAVELASASPEPPALLRARVTSKGGTTEAAVRVLDERGVGDAIRAAVAAADARARELGELLGRGE